MKPKARVNIQLNGMEVITRLEFIFTQLLSITKHCTKKCWWSNDESFDQKSRCFIAGLMRVKHVTWSEIPVFLAGLMIIGNFCLSEVPKHFFGIDDHRKYLFIRNSEVFFRDWYGLCHSGESRNPIQDFKGYRNKSGMTKSLLWKPAPLVLVITK